MRHRPERGLRRSRMSHSAALPTPSRRSASATAHVDRVVLDRVPAVRGHVRVVAARVVPGVARAMDVAGVEEDAAQRGNRAGIADVAERRRRGDADPAVVLRGSARQGVSTSTAARSPMTPSATMARTRRGTRPGGVRTAGARATASSVGSDSAPSATSASRPARAAAGSSIEAPSSRSACIAWRVDQSLRRVTATSSPGARGGSSSDTSGVGGHPSAASASATPGAARFDSAGSNSAPRSPRAESEGRERSPAGRVDLLRERSRARRRARARARRPARRPRRARVAAAPAATTASASSRRAAARTPDSASGTDPAISRRAAAQPLRGRGVASGPRAADRRSAWAASSANATERGPATASSATAATRGVTRNDTHHGGGRSSESGG